MLRRVTFAVLLAAGASANALAQNSGPVDFGRIPGVAAEPNVDVDLNAAMLGFVTEAARAGGSDAADAAAALSGLKRVRVRVYEKLRDPAAVEAFVDGASKSLEQAGWQRAVYVTDDGDKVRVYVKMQDRNVSGMNVMVLDGDDEAVFINIDGSIEPAQLGRLMRMAGVGGAFGTFSGYRLPGRAGGFGGRRRSGRPEGPAHAPAGERQPQRDEQNAGDRNAGAQSGHDQPAGDRNAGAQSGHGQTTGEPDDGDHNAGDQDAGDRNADAQNGHGQTTGEPDDGDHNAGDQDAGDRNAGAQSGHGQTTGQTTGEQDDGDHNAGDQDAGEQNPGH